MVLIEVLEVLLISQTLVLYQRSHPVYPGTSHMRSDPVTIHIRRKVYAQFVSEMKAVVPLEGPHAMITPKCRLNTTQEKEEEEEAAAAAADEDDDGEVQR